MPLEPPLRLGHPLRLEYPLRLGHLFPWQANAYSIVLTSSKSRTFLVGAAARFLLASPVSLCSLWMLALWVVGKASLHERHQLWLVCYLLFGNSPRLLDLWTAVLVQSHHFHSWWACDQRAAILGPCVCSLNQPIARSQQSPVQQHECHQAFQQRTMHE